MARREFQDPSILERDGKQGREYYIRYRVKVLRMVNGEPKCRKREKWHVLGLCSKMTKRQAERKKEEVMREVNGQVYSVQSQIPFSDFMALYRERRMPSLRRTTQGTYDGMLRNYIEPYFAGKKLSDITPPDIHAFVTGLDLAPLRRKPGRSSIRSRY